MEVVINEKGWQEVEQRERPRMRNRVSCTLWRVFFCFLYFGMEWWKIQVLNMFSDARHGPVVEMIGGQAIDKMGCSYGGGDKVKSGGADGRAVGLSL